MQQKKIKHYGWIYIRTIKRNFRNKTSSYKLNNSENIIQSLNKIADEMYKIAKENNEYIDKILNNACNKKEC